MEVQMLGKEDFLLIQALAKRGVYLCDIAQELGVHPKTVSRALKRGGAPSRRRRPRSSMLDPYQARIDQLLSEGVWNAQVVLREIQTQGYPGGITILRDYMQPKRVLRPGRATVRFETAPGRQLQSDWGTITRPIAGVETAIHFSVNTLSYSRRFHFWGTDSEDAEHTYEGLVRSFEYFGGVPAEVLVDNQKVAVLEHRPGQCPRFNERFLDLAAHYGFSPRAARPHRARTKGKDERNVGYIKHHFFVRYRAFESWEHLNQLAEQWLREEADPRCHGTVREVVAERFVREAPALGALPARRYDTAYRENRLVSWDAYIDVGGNRYSVPDTLVGRHVTVRIGFDGALMVYDGDTFVVGHRLRPAAEGWVTVPEHHARLWRELGVEHRPLAVYEEVGAWS
jgi:transposase